MAVVTPFRGILYNKEKIQDLKDVVTPPYDVISELERQKYCDRHPQNIIRLILSKGGPDDDAMNNRYTRAAAFFRSWLEKGILKQDPEPALYVTEMGFGNEGEIRTRLGFIALVRLEDFEKGMILPHEKTFSATKADRLRLMEACSANFSPVFSLFSDPKEQVMGPLRSWTNDVRPDMDFKEITGYHHRLWRVKDGKLHSRIADELSSRHLFIADGHHRYETALNYRNIMAARLGGLEPNSGYNYVMMYLSSMQDPGMVMRPVHRLLCHIRPTAMDEFVKRAAAFFDVKTINVENYYSQELRSSFLAEIRSGADPAVMGAIVRGHKAFYVLRARKGVMDDMYDGKIPAPLRQLDVTVATRLVLQKTLGFEETDLDDETRILYTSRASKAFEAVNSGKCDIALILNPTKLAHMEEISRAGLVMPRKSTYFFPKVLSGLVMNMLHPDRKP